MYSYLQWTIYNFFIWVLFSKNDTAKYNCHVSIRTTICLPRLHMVDCSTLVTTGFMVYTMQPLFCGFTLRVWWLGCMGVGLYWISDQQNLDRSIENDTATCRTSPEMWKTVNCSTNCKRMKDDKITVIDDLHISTRAIYFTRWPMNGMRQRTAHHRLDCTLSFTIRPIKLSTCLVWGTWSAVLYLVLYVV